jgi:S-adenosylmethionine synthetase
MQEKIKTCEFVSPKHPDKICDFIADSILEEYVKQDPESRVAIEVMGGHKHITVSGEITSAAKVDIKKIIKECTLLQPQAANYEISVNISRQSEYIAKGVDQGGAGDQGIMSGFATLETESLMPREYVLARDLCKFLYGHYPYDGKVQVTLKGQEVLAVIASFQNSKSSELEALAKSFIKSKNITAKNYHINSAGEWSLGGFDADSGLSGRKIVIDNYGPEIAVGGGSFSGKDMTKVDRSGAYIARKIAVDLLKKQVAAQSVFVKLAYAIGEKQPLMAVAQINNEEIDISGKYELSPEAIRKILNFQKIKYSETCQWVHFGNAFVWDQPY